MIEASVRLVSIKSNLTLVSVNTGQRGHRTPLFLSVRGQHLEAARSLLEAGARLDREDQEGNSIRQLARKPDLLNLSFLKT